MRRHLFSELALLKFQHLPCQAETSAANTFWAMPTAGFVALTHDLARLVAGARGIRNLKSEGVSMEGMRFRSYASTAIFILCLAQLAAGQRDHNLPKKFDEFTKCRQPAQGCINLEDEWARLDAVVQQLKSDRSAEVYIIGYKAADLLPGNSLQHLTYIRNYVQSRVVDDSRVHLIDAGYSDRLTVELWLGSSTPPLAPRKTTGVEEPDYRSAYKFQQYQPRLHREVPKEFEEDEREMDKPSALLDGFAALLESRPNLRAYIIAYDAPGDRIGTTYKLAETYRAYLFESASIGLSPHVATNASSRVVSIRGGRRRQRTIELWVAPDSQPAPLPHPDAQTARKRKLRHHDTGRRSNPNR